MKDASDAADAAESAAKENEDKPENADAAPSTASGDAAAATATPKNKAPARRKSTAGESAKGKKLNKKASKAAILHTDAKPGEHYFIKLKGFPQWPCIICDEDMLPHALLKSRPVSAARPDGQYREDFADGGKRAADRTFPIMYLATNEFGWVSNKDLIDLDPEKVMEQVNAKMRKDLIVAHQLAEEHHDLAYYKGVLNQFQEELLEKQKAAEAKAAAAATPKASKKKTKAAAAAADEDVDMEDIDDEPSAKKEKKRKNPEDAETPQRSDSVKKPKIKLTNNTPKSNGTGAKATKGGSEAKSSKKAKKLKEDSEERLQTPKEPEMSAEDRFERKKKEVLFLRHKLQKGLLTRDQQPKEEEMKMMSDYLTKLESFPDLETEIIRVTKINKVLKAMLKLDNIPKESDFEFKPRSQVLLDKWNKLLATEDGSAPAASEEANGVNGHKTEKPSGKETKSAVNGAEKTDTEEPEAPKKDAKAGVKEAEEDTQVDTPAPEVDQETKEGTSTEEKPQVEGVRHA
ncbi:hypothetical protein M406DRAFT_264694 [Cryphonectria parasitica EP155]|uniref:PWWP domain-containing protein n=1 Tax=Cryphonectria parasitica (strain ATCC 38755 / EP155) TaxID=660469 RepID=A0A9P4XWW5_CRYP1|nr:uncharacterized protein M406DRAFT_264694 [Cryphonectria parasitica EP155]KAF3762398.1 hypothetical protein M406DRAFT_264694 [Cryphonectria parasitica EP155]